MKKNSHLAGSSFNLPLVEVDLGDLEDEVGETSADTLDGSEGEHGLALSVDVCVLDSQNVSELLILHEVERCSLASLSD